ncbi:MAG: hypothetical protein Q8J63_06730 [Candidatus Aquicultor sp.]|nr:hypothetical protein [Candidatus Aquicultor sp.]
MIGTITKKAVVTFIVLVLVSALSACSASDGQDGAKSTVTTQKKTATSDSKTVKDIPAKNRPKTKTGSLSIEGMTEDFTFTLADSVELEFTTYIASDMIAESASSSEGDSLFIYANYGGEKNRNARLFFFARPKAVKSSIEEMTELAKETIKVEGFRIKEPVAGNGALVFEWSQAEFDIEKQDKNGSRIVGIVSIFSHAGRVYWLIAEYPEELTEGFVQRMVKAAENIMWYDEKPAR